MRGIGLQRNVSFHSAGLAVSLAIGGFCLAEAARASHRCFLAKASVITLHQDARKGRLALRFAACNPELETRCGFFGQADLAAEFSLDSLGQRNASLMVIIVCELCLRARVRGRGVKCSG